MCEEKAIFEEKTNCCTSYFLCKVLVKYADVCMAFHSVYFIFYQYLLFIYRTVLPSFRFVDSLMRYICQLQA